MTLLHADGFDAQNALIAGSYTVLRGTVGNLTNTTGRTGTGSAIVGTGSSTNFAGCSLGVQIPSSSTVTIGLALKNGGGSNATSAVIEWRSAGVSIGRILVLSTSSSPAGQMSANRGAVGGTATLLGTTSVPVPSTYFQYVEVKIVCSTGSAGQVVVRQDGTQTLNLTSQNTGSAAIDEVGLCLQGDNANCWGAALVLDDWYICNDQGTVNNDFLGDVRILTLLPNGNGSSSQMVGSDLDSTDNYLLVGELPPSTANYVDSGTTGNKDTYAYQDLANNYDIKGVQVHSYAGQVAGGTLKGRAVAKSGATTATGSDKTLGTAPVVYREVFENNPSGSVPWNPLTLNAAEFGWEVRT